MFTNSIQIWNLLKVLNKDKALHGLNSIKEVCENAVNIDEEVYLYHLNKDNYQNTPALLEKSEKSEKSEMSINNLSEIIEIEDINSVSNKFNS